MPAWSALKESNLPLRVKSPVHNRYAKDGVWPAREDSNSRPAGSKPAALLQLSYGQGCGGEAWIRTRAGLAPRSFSKRVP